jgi:hypothetical protein
MQAVPKLITKHIMLLKKIKNKKQNKQIKPPKKPKTSQNCSDWIRTLSVNLQRSRSSDYSITAFLYPGVPAGLTPF